MSYSNLAKNSSSFSDKSKSSDPSYLDNLKHGLGFTWDDLDIAWDDLNDQDTWDGFGNIVWSNLSKNTSNYQELVKNLATFYNVLKHGIKDFTWDDLDISWDKLSEQDTWDSFMEIVWTEADKNSASYSQFAINEASYNQMTKDLASYVNEMKNSSSYSQKTKTTASYANRTKN